MPFPTCTSVRNVTPWHEGGSHRATQTRVGDIDLEIHVHLGKRRKPRGTKSLPKQAHTSDLPDGLIIRNHVKPARQKQFALSET